MSQAVLKEIEFSLKDIWGVLPVAVPFYLAHHAEKQSDNTVLTYICATDERAAEILRVLENIAPEIEAFHLPEWDCLPYDRSSPSPEISAQRAHVLKSLLQPADGKKRILLVSANGFLQRTPPRSFYAGSATVLKAGATIDPTELMQELEKRGYVRTTTVREKGEFAWRGGILDAFPARSEYPFRADFFDDQIETLKSFDPVTQRSVGPLEEISLEAPGEMLLDDKSRSLFKEGWVEHFGPAALEDELVKKILDGQRAQGMEHYLSLFHKGVPRSLETIADFLPPKSEVIFENESFERFDARFELIEDHYHARISPEMKSEEVYRPLPIGELYLDPKEVVAIAAKFDSFKANPFERPETGEGEDAGYRPAPLFSQSLEGGQEGVIEAFIESAQKWAKEGKRVGLAIDRPGIRSRVEQFLKDKGVKSEEFENFKKFISGQKAKIGLVSLDIERGFLTPDLALLSEQDLFGEIFTRASKKKRKKAENFLSNVSEITQGDLVVHEEYGIGRYSGLETVSEGNVSHDYLSISYQDNQRLLLPVENIDLLSRFGSEESGVQLDRMGGAGWQARKAKMKSRLREMAAELIRTAAMRAMKEAPVAEVTGEEWEEFRARFPYVETDDQSRAIADVVEDLQRGVPMDRLVCGDVGFGKTEVALRAACVASLSGMQVAVVVPTTLLARQHYLSFKERFKGLPVKIGMLSRLTSAKDAKRYRQELEDGTLDIIIGTHALFSHRVKFKNLGLLIVDEEQHFGVTHKEKLKSLREDVHVLTLSATPLPRTLQLSLTGVREMSLIATPPTDRMPVRTFISPYDSVMMREALKRELFRNGQIFCVTPRLKEMDRIEETLKGLIPELRIKRAHGQLPSHEIEEAMEEFSSGKYDVLLSTNIVESGLDLPQVNTIIIFNADKFGLGQLYQLRGRVGRGKKRGYAYLTWPSEHKLSPAAVKRLEIMQSLDSLGAGFTLASHDLDLRGAGNLLGDEQSGHIKEVGVELYQQMLSEAVAEMRSENRGQVQEDSWTPQIILGLPVLLPEDYIKDLSSRMSIYRRIGNLENLEEVEDMRAELIDRFGPIPEEAENLLQTVLLKNKCKALGVERLEVGSKGLVVSFRNNTFSNPEGLLEWAQKKVSAGIRIRSDQKLAYIKEMLNDTRIPTAHKILTILEKIANKA